MWHVPISRYFGINSFLHTSRISECQLGMDCKNYADHVQHRPKDVKGPLLSSLHAKQNFNHAKDACGMATFLSNFFIFGGYSWPLLPSRNSAMLAGVHQSLQSLRLLREHCLPHCEQHLPPE